MSLQPFTPDGVQAKTKELYALPDADLQRQADLIAANFRSWISANFTLDAKQSAFLTGMDSKFAAYCGTVTSAAVGHRLPVTIKYPTPPSTYSSKYIIIDPGLIPRYDTTAGYTVTGSLNFTFGYVS